MNEIGGLYVRPPSRSGESVVSGQPPLPCYQNELISGQMVHPQRNKSSQQMRL